MKIYAYDAHPAHQASEGVAHRPLVNPELAGIRTGLVEQLVIAPGAEVRLQRDGQEERWYYVAAGQGTAQQATGRHLLQVGSLIWLGSDAGCTVTNSGAEALELIEVCT